MPAHHQKGEGAAVVTAAARAVFVAGLKQHAGYDGAVPDPLPLNRVLSLLEDVAECLADERTAKGIFRIVARRDEQAQRYFVDYFYDRGESGSWHARVYEDGTVEALENLEAQWGWPVLADPEQTKRERERIGAHNRRVREILRAKGFGS